MTSVNTFIQHPFSSIKGHMITVNKIIADFEKEAHVGCGLHFEIFEARVLNKVSHASQQMDEKTKEIFLSYAKSKGYDLTEQERANEEYMDILREQQDGDFDEVDEIPF